MNEQRRVRIRTSVAKSLPPRPRLRTLAIPPLSLATCAETIYWRDFESYEADATYSYQDRRNTALDELDALDEGAPVAAVQNYCKARRMYDAWLDRATTKSQRGKQTNDESQTDTNSGAT